VSVLASTVRSLMGRWSGGLQVISAIPRAISGRQIRDARQGRLFAATARQRLILPKFLQFVNCIVATANNGIVAAQNAEITGSIRICEAYGQSPPHWSEILS